MRKILTIAGALGVALTFGLAAAPAASAAGYDGTDPVATGCVSGAYVVQSWNFQKGEGRAELVYSPRCGTNWVNVYGYLAGQNYWATISVPSTSKGGQAITAGVSSEHSRQVYAPGNTCVVVAWGHRVPDTGLVGGGTAYVGSC
ncbi:hypothetical protein FHU41_001860 [Psychromicrobium silvestre]|uniref:DUF2690 domain-containing protein n=1 Tax=Psychromicrobium silvestre TaxID=1645614 RepID=A0A7Y9LU57_9MICC|nr:hypothetical protein [Psychromicrobium silvestre]